MSAATSAERGPRLLAVDALRGFDMFWIIGGDMVMRSLGAMDREGWLGALGRQFEHASWAGFRAYDLVFPLFIFIAGISVALAVPRQIAERGRRRVVYAIGRRVALLFALGILYNGGFANGWGEVRWLGILQRIGLVYGACALLLVARCSARRLIVIAGAILLSYWAVLAFVPVKRITLEKQALAARYGVANPTRAEAQAWWQEERTWQQGDYAEGQNLANHLDLQFVPGKLYYRYWDPEGVLSTLPAIVTGMLGMLAGWWLSRSDLSINHRSGWLVVAGLAGVLAGWCWHPYFPVVKNLWSSSFVLVTAGWSAALLGAFLWIVDGRGARRWCEVFVWVGRNPIALYLATSLVPFRQIATRLAGPDAQRALDRAWIDGAGACAHALIVLGLVLTLAWFLQRQRIFLKV